MDPFLKLTFSIIVCFFPPFKLLPISIMQCLVHENLVSLEPILAPEHHHFFVIVDMLLVLFGQFPSVFDSLVLDQVLIFDFQIICRLRMLFLEILDQFGIGSDLCLIQLSFELNHLFLHFLELILELLMSILECNEVIVDLLVPIGKLLDFVSSRLVLDLVLFMKRLEIRIFFNHGFKLL